MAARSKSDYVERRAGGGAGNPGGLGAITTSYANSYYGNSEKYAGASGTGGLLIIYGSKIQNTSSGKIEANGSNGGYGDTEYDNRDRAIYVSRGGSSGGGSINIFYREKIEQKGNISARGGYNGGYGCISIGTILQTGTYKEDE